MNTLTEFETERHALLLPLTFLISSERRDQQRKRTPGFCDSALFYRLWSLFGVISVTQNRKQLVAQEEAALAQFLEIYECLPWLPIESHPHISKLDSDDLSPLVPSAHQMLALIKTESKGVGGSGNYNMIILPNQSADPVP